MKIAVMGMEYVELIQAIPLAHVGFEVYGMGVGKEKLDKLNKDILILYENGLESLLKKIY